MYQFEGLENFWKRYNKVLLDKVALDKEKSTLTQVRDTSFSVLTPICMTLFLTQSDQGCDSGTRSWSLTPVGSKCSLTRGILTRGQRPVPWIHQQT